MNGESSTHLTLSRESRSVTKKWLALIAAHFRVELSEPEVQIFCDSLAREDPERLEKAFQRCLHECEYFPKLKDIHERMPYRAVAVKTDSVPSGQHYEPIDDDHHLHVWITADGGRYVRIERKK